MATMSKAKLRACLKSMTEDERLTLLKSLDDADGDSLDGDDDSELRKSDDDGDEDDDGEDTDGDEDLEKSIREIEDALSAGTTRVPAAGDRLGGGQQTTLAKSFDGSGFVGELVTTTAEHLDDLGALVGELAEASSRTATGTLALARVVQGQRQALRKSMRAQAELGEKLDQLLAAVQAPTGPRSVTARPLAKSFSDGATGFEQLKKSQVSDALLRHQRRLAESGDRTGAQVASDEIVRFNSGGGLTPYTQAVLREQGLVQNH